MSGKTPIDPQSELDAEADRILAAYDPREAHLRWVAAQVEADRIERSERRDLVLRFVDACYEMGPAGGLVFIFGGTTIIVIFSLALIATGSLIWSALT